MKKLIALIIVTLIGQSVVAQGYAVLYIHNPLSTDVIVTFKSIDNHESNTVQETSKNGFFNVPFKGRVQLNIFAPGCKQLIDTIFAKEGVFYSYTLQTINIHLGEVVTTGQYSAKTSDQSVFNTSVISRQQIEERGNANLDNALSHEINIRISADPILGSQVKLQGIGGQDVKILIDGIPVIGRNNGNIDLSQINLNTIDHIEITQGPMSVLYGTNAMGGVINLITKTQFVHPVEFHIHSMTESVGRYNVDADLSLHNSKNTILFDGGRNFFSGYPKDTGNLRSQIWKPNLQAFGGITLTHRFHQSVLNIKSQYFYGLLLNLGDPTITPFYADALDQYYKTIRFDNSLNYNYRLNEFNNISLLASCNYYRNSTIQYSKNLVSLKDTLTPPGNQDTTTFISKILKLYYNSSNPNKKINYQTGFDFDYESGYGSLLNHGIQSINDNAIFGSLEWKPTQTLIIRPGVRVSENSAYGNTLFNNSKIKLTPLLPSVNIKKDLHKNIIMRLGLARGYRAPELKELYLNFVDANHDIHGNSSLNSEISWHTDFQTTFYVKTGGVDLRFEPMIFYNNIKNLITLVNTGTSAMSYKYFNIGAFNTYGFTLPINICIHRFNVSISYSITALYDTISSHNSSATPYTYTQEISGNAGYNFIKQKLNLNLSYKYTGATPGYITDAQNRLSKTTISAYTLLDAGITKYFYEKKLAITVGVKNLLNIGSVYSNIPAGPHNSSSDLLISPGRSMFIDLRLSLYKKR